jgi:hypothetical protein
MERLTQVRCLHLVRVEYRIRVATNVVLFKIHLDLVRNVVDDMSATCINNFNYLAKID